MLTPNRLLALLVAGFALGKLSDASDDAEELEGDGATDPAADGGPDISLEEPPEPDGSEEVARALRAGEEAEARSRDRSSPAPSRRSRQDDGGGDGLDEPPEPNELRAAVAGRG